MGTRCIIVACFLEKKGYALLRCIPGVRIAGYSAETYYFIFFPCDVTFAQHEYCCFVLCQTFHMKCKTFDMDSTYVFKGVRMHAINDICIQYVNL